MSHLKVRPPNNRMFAGVAEGAKPCGPPREPVQVSLIRRQRERIGIGLRPAKLESKINAI